MHCTKGIFRQVNWTGAFNPFKQLCVTFNIVVYMSSSWYMRLKVKKKTHANNRRRAWCCQLSFRKKRRAHAVLGAVTIPGQ